MALKVLELAAVDFSLWHFLRNLSTGIISKDFNLLMASSPGPYRERLEALGFPFYPIAIKRNRNPFSHLFAAWELRQLVKKEKIHIVHVHTPVAAFVARLSRFFGNRALIVYTVHGFYFHDRAPWLTKLIHVSLEKILGGLTDVMFYQSLEDFRTSQYLKLAPRAQHTWIGNGIDAQRFSPKNQLSARQRFGIPHDAFVISSIGRLVSEKGHLELFKAFRSLVSENPRFHLMVAAPDIVNAHDRLTRSSLLDLIPVNMRSHVHFFEYVEDVPEFLAASDVYVLASYREGVPRSVMEAMAMELPCVVTSVRGSRELIQHQDGGYHVEVRNWQSLREGILRVYEDPPEKRALFGKRNRKFVQANCNEDLITQKQVDEFYEAVKFHKHRTEILWHCHFFYPDVCAPSSRSINLISGSSFPLWQALTTFSHHPKNQKRIEDRSKFFETESLDVELLMGRRHRSKFVQVYRTFILLPKIKPFLKQLTGHLSFTMSALFSVFMVKRKPTVVITSSPTLFSAISGWLLARFWRARWILEIRDLWPSIFTELGIMKESLPLKILIQLELFLYRRADHIVAVTEGFKIDISNRAKLPLDRISVIRNTADVSKYYPRKQRPESAPFTVGYIGTLGRSQGVEDVLNAWIAANIPGKFLIVGEGQDKPLVKAIQHQYPERNIEIRSSVPSSQILSVYHELDVGIVCLKDIPLFDSFIPSKIFELMGAAVPIAGILRGESARIVQESSAGWVSRDGSINAVADLFREIYQKYLEKSEWENKLQGPIAMKSKFSLEKFAKDYDQVIAKVIFN